MARLAPKTPIELVIEDLAFGGEGVARHQGEVHFVAGAYPGEKVIAVPIRGKKRWKRARLLQILQSSPDRVEPRCRHTDLCGGCVYQTLAYPIQLDAKARQVRENLARIAGVEVPEPEPPLPAPKRFHYRNKMEFSFAPRAWDPDGPPELPQPGPALGLHIPGRYDAIFDIHDCVICDPRINDLIALVRDFAKEKGIAGYHGRTQEGLLRHLVVRSSEATGEWLVVLVVRGKHDDLNELAERAHRAHPQIAGFLLWIHEGLATVARGDEEIVLFGKNRIVEKLGDVEFELSGSSFFQTNTQAAAGLLAELRRVTPRVETILDLFCGVGTLGIGLADRCDHLIGVESVESAVIDARRNAERNRITHARFELAKTEDWLRSIPSIAPDLVIVDPPRAGLHPKALEGLITLRPNRITYVSCNPSTLARDVAGLTESGYRAESARVLDLFPHTPHVETILQLSRGDG